MTRDDLRLGRPSALHHRLCLGGYNVVVEAESTTPQATVPGRAACRSMKAVRMLGIAASPFILGASASARNPNLLAGMFPFINRHHPRWCSCPLEESASEPARDDALPGPDRQRHRWVSSLLRLGHRQRGPSTACRGVLRGTRRPLSQTEIGLFIAAMLVGPTLGASGHRRIGGSPGQAVDNGHGGGPGLGGIKSALACLHKRSQFFAPGLTGLIMLSLIVGGVEPSRLCHWVWPM